MIDKIIALRRELHKYPELSKEETKTSSKIQQFLTDLKVFEIYQITETGFVAVLDTMVEGPSVLVRAELDGLPIKEKTDLDYTSAFDGKAHSCGHDGHMAIVCGLAMKLAENPPAKGRVILCFQAAEETGEGALEIIEHENFKPFEPDYVYALHNLPGHEKGLIVVKEGAFTAAVESVAIRLSGKTAHAAEPEQGHNPTWLIGEILSEVLRLQNTNAKSDSFCLITPVYIHAGEKAYGISAGDGEIHFTLRAFDNELLEKKKKELVKFVEDKAKAANLSADFEWMEPFTANINGKEAVKLITDACDELNIEYARISDPLRWGEDFGEFSSRYPGALFGLGSGKNQPALHNPDYDFPDEIMENGIAVFDRIVRKLL
ncbi:amidohydrolase [Fulvivirgaceae bacterium LMO-SS25]